MHPQKMQVFRLLQHLTMHVFNWTVSLLFRSRLTAEPKLLPQEEVTYAEPLHLPTQNSKSLNSPKSTLRKVQQHANSTAAQETLFQFPEAYAPPSYAQQV